MKPSEIVFGLLRIPSDFLMALFAFLLAYDLRTVTNPLPGMNLPLDLGSFPDLAKYTAFSVSASIVLMALFAANRMYSLKSTLRISTELKKVVTVISTGLMALIAWFFLIRAFPFSRLALIYTWILSIVLISAGRLLIRLVQYFTLKAGIGKKRILFIGNNIITKKLAQALAKDYRYELAGNIDHIDKIEELDAVVKKERIEQIIQAKADLSKSQAAEILDFCREHHLEFQFVPNLLEVQQANIETETLAGIPVIKLKPTPLDGWGKVSKRIFDLVGAVLGLIIFSPLFIAAAVAIKLDSKGNIFFRFLDDGSPVKRVGERGQLFNFYKFRTMLPNTHNLRYSELALNNLRGNSPLVKIRDDPRVTKIGKLLRKTSIDELPQLINVLKGDMSLAGPRPHLPEEVAKYQQHHKFVLTIKPGITGLAQISGRSDLAFEDEVRLDTYYIEHWSLWLDLKILARTFVVLLKGYRE